MMRSVWFFLKLGLIVGLTGWLATRDGHVALDAFSYEIEAPLGLVLASLFIALSFAWIAMKLLGWLLSIPRRAGQRLQTRKQDQGVGAIMGGLSAMAAGDSRGLRNAAKAIPAMGKDDHGLSLFMGAMADRLDGKIDAANEGFTQLMRRPESAFLGVRALYQQAVETGQHKQALNLARQAYTLHPKQGWVVTIRYDEEVRAHNWLEAETLLTRLVRMKMMTKDQAASDRAAMALAKLQDTDDDKKRLALIRAALKKQPGHCAATLLWIDHLISKGNATQATRAVEKAWKACPHPQLAQFWLDCMPATNKKTQKRRIRWVQRLVTLHPDHGQSHLLLAKFYMTENLLDQASAALDHAEKAEGLERAALQLRADLAQAKGEGDVQVKHYLNQAAESQPGYGWVCHQSGRSYTQWSAFAAPHNSFNTICWGMAGANQNNVPHIGSPHRNFLLN